MQGLTSSPALTAAAKLFTTANRTPLLLMSLLKGSKQVRMQGCRSNYG